MLAYLCMKRFQQFKKAFLVAMALMQVHLGGCLLFSLGVAEQDKGAGQQADLPNDPKALLAIAGSKIETGLVADMRLALKALEKAGTLGEHGLEYDLLKERTLYKLALYSSPDEQPESARKALALAEKLVKEHPDRVEGYYYRGVTTGLLASRDPSVGVSKLGDVIKDLEKAVEIDESFDHAAPRRALGVVYLKAPSYPTGPGDLDAALEHLEKAVKLSPGWAENWLYLAEAKLEDDDVDTALRCSKKALKLASKLEGKAGAEWRERARGIIRRIRELKHRSGEYGF